ncbi:MAG: hypothetical protein IKP30_06690, partial [Bacteroidaceae bacterium]|nr:hypothetical protein [Bacteroidaceae bacterium]
LVIWRVFVWSFGAFSFGHLAQKYSRSAVTPMGFKIQAPETRKWPSELSGGHFSLYQSLI